MQENLLNINKISPWDYASYMMGLSQFKYDFNLFKIAKTHKIDIAVGSSITITHVSRFYKMKSITFLDNPFSCFISLANSYIRSKYFSCLSFGIPLRS